MGGGQKAEAANFQNLAMPEELEISALRLRCDLFPFYTITCQRSLFPAIHSIVFFYSI